MKNVLVFPCGSEIGLEINRALAYSTHFTLFGANSVNDHGRYVYQNYISGLPYIDSPDFIEALNQVVDQYKIDFIIPAHDSAVLKLADNQKDIHASVITSPATTCRICRSKRDTYATFEKLIPTPKVYDQFEELSFPVFLKPDSGQGSKGVYKANSPAEIAFYCKKDPSLLVLEYLPGKEYTIDCFTNKDGELLFSEGRERVRISNGISVNSKAVANPKFKSIAEVINNTLSFRGVWFFQLKERGNGELVIMEVAPRIAGTMALFRMQGINFVQLSLFDRMGFPVKILTNNLDIEIDRALFSRYSLEFDYDSIFIDFDDTIITNGKVNTDVLKFLYQCKNMNKEVVLLTRHKKDIKATLTEFAISPLLFDRIFLLTPQEKKSTFIKNIKAVFIDDSFAERKEVSDSLGIPVFSVDAIEALFIWKV